MDKFIEKIVENVGYDGFRLTAVINPDGFLYRADTQENVLRESGLLLLPVQSSLELRVRYETTDRWSDNRICYIIKDSSWILPDLMQIIHILSTFSLPKLLPALNSNILLNNELLTFSTASYLYNKHYKYNLSAIETKSLINEVKNTLGVSKEELIDELSKIRLNWDDAITIETISKIINKALKYNLYDSIENSLSEINYDFQKYLNKSYFTKISSSAIQRPKMVNKILPYIARNHSRDEKVALVVIDGMAYWQYLLLSKEIQLLGISTVNSFTFAWLPSITKLSRQAIFKGDIPNLDYKQSPYEEQKLWESFWISQNGYKKVESYNISYNHGTLTIDNPNKTRQALVDTTLDERMHAVRNIRELYLLSEEWAQYTALDIKNIYEMGYQIYITTDHGNIQASPWRLLNSHEKTYLYEKESRGSRHLIYSNHDYLNLFITKNEDIKNALLVKDNWAVWRNSKSFSNNIGITHGGAHFLEVVIPFIIINKK
ncbi:MAG: PglZ domain-containing protein [Parabacteroides sp.]|nr:PglZ domain-containing protein [Parabacteroides sp.]